MSFDLETNEDKNLLYKIFVAHACDGCSSAPLTQYKNNDIYRDLIEEYDYFDEKVMKEFILIGEEVRVTLMN